jgi:membrane protein required for beta-lactamase induction
MKRLDRAAYALIMLALLLLVVLAWVGAGCRRVRREIVRDASDRVVDKATDVVERAIEGPSPTGSTK